MAGIDVRVSGQSEVDGKVTPAHVSANGEILVRQYGYSQSYINTMTGTTNPYNFLGTKPDKQFVLTGVFVSANRSIDAAGDLVEIFEAPTDSSATQDKLLFSLDIARQQIVSISLPGVKITQGKYLNGDRADATGTITVSLYGYFIPTID